MSGRKRRQVFVSKRRHFQLSPQVGQAAPPVVTAERDARRTCTLVARHNNVAMRLQRRRIGCSVEGCGEIFVPEAAVFQDAGLGRVVDIIKTESLAVTRRPFEIVEQ